MSDDFTNRPKPGCYRTDCKLIYPHWHEAHLTYVTPGTSRWTQEWNKFTETLTKRLEAGEREYGDASFDSSAISNIDEIEEELLDVCGWAYIMWTKLQTMRPKLEALERTLEDSDAPT